LIITIFIVGSIAINSLITIIVSHNKRTDIIVNKRLEKFLWRN
jgi:hypothetical protein